MPLKLKISTLWPSTNWSYRQPSSYWPWVVFNEWIIHLIAPISLVAVLSLLINLSMWIEFQDLVFFIVWTVRKGKKGKNHFPFFPLLLIEKTSVYWCGRDHWCCPLLQSGPQVGLLPYPGRPCQGLWQPPPSSHPTGFGCSSQGATGICELHEECAVWAEGPDLD